jgi:hypothetical protein
MDLWQDGTSYLSHAEQGFAPDALQRPLRSRFRARLKPGVMQQHTDYATGPWRGQPGVRLPLHIPSHSPAALSVVAFAVGINALPFVAERVGEPRL